MDTDELLPWQQHQYQEFVQLAGSSRFGHAWLVSGIAGIGKLHFVRLTAKFLLCQRAQNGRPCGQCTSCHLFGKGTHPDWFLLQPPKRMIIVDQIRDAIDFASNTSQRGGRKILCIDPAEAMNLSAANALLKLLEEPPAGTLLFLLSQQPGLLLATLRSRCQQLKLSLPPRDVALAWLAANGCAADAVRLLQKAGGAPLRALALTETGVLAEHDNILQCVQELLCGAGAPVQLARRCEKFNIVSVMDTMLQATSEMAVHVQTEAPMGDRQLQPIAETLMQRSRVPAARALHVLHASLARARKNAMSSNNPNSLLLLEQVFAEWGALRPRTTPVTTSSRRMP
ncbi:MAG: DNA polymerase III subunit delta' [Pseudohongiellaceae bacterium]